MSIFLLQTARYSKLEKADILEMTVKHLRALQRHQMAGNKAKFKQQGPYSRTIYRRLRIGRDVHLDQSEACDIS